MKSSNTSAVLVGAAGYASLGAVRSLGRLGVPVYCVHGDRRSAATRSRYSAGAFRWDFEGQGEAETVGFLVSLASRLGAKPVLVPVGDENSLLIERHAETLSGHFLFPRSRTGAAESLCNKRSLLRLAGASGVPTPETVFVGSPDEVLAVGSRLEYPVVVKPVDATHGYTGADWRIRVVDSASGLEAACRAVAVPGSSGAAIQEFIPNRAGDRGIVSAYRDSRGGGAFAVTGRKLRQLPVVGGDTTFAVTEPCEAMVEHTFRVAAAAGYRGAIDADYCRDDRDGRWKLLDFNPRFGANFRALSDRNGLDVVRALYLDMTTGEIPGTEPWNGRHWLVENKDFWAVREQADGKSGTLWPWLRSIRETDEFAFWSLDDLRPSISFATGFVSSLIRGAIMNRLQGRGHDRPD